MLLNFLHFIVFETLDAEIMVKAILLTLQISHAIN